MKIIVTGKSGVGKTTILKSISNNVFFADDFVKNTLYKKDHPVFNQIKQMYPSVAKNNFIDTKKLGLILFNNKEELEKVSLLVIPYIQEKIKSFDEDILIEMATYIKYEKHFKYLIDKVILIKRKNYDLSKFDYIDNMKQPIQNKNIKVDKVILNDSNIDQATNEFKNYLKEINFFVK